MENDKMRRTRELKPHQFQRKINGQTSHLANITLRLDNETKEKLKDIPQWQDALRNYIDDLVTNTAPE
jgi:hypothetical protein